MTDNVFLVLGATGKTGRRVAARLKELGKPVRPLSRSTEIRFDWSDRSTWGPAVAGGGALYLVSPGQNPVHEFVQQAVEAGVRRIVLLSARGADQVPMPGVLDGEKAVRASGVEWTILRPNHFFQNFSEDLLREPLLAGEVALPTGDEPDPMVDAEDIADVAVTALTRDGHAGKTYTLTGPHGVSFKQATETIAKASGRDVRYVALSGKDYVAGLLAEGVSPETAESLRIVFEAVRDGQIAQGSDDVRRVLGREPRDFESYVRRELAAWT